VKHYIIDGNNLIGKIKSLCQIQKRNKQHSREKLAFILSRFFSRKKVSVSLHYDGFEKENIKVSNIKIIYSDNHSADDKIKKEIERSKNPKNVILITSDSNLAEFGRVCSCQVKKCEEFLHLINSADSENEEQSRIDMLDDTVEFKRLFGIK